MNDLAIFENPEFGHIRGLKIEGEPWFVGKDVAAALGYVNTADALKKQANISIDKKKIVQDEPIKSFGDFSLKAKLGYEITATISVHVSEA